MSTNCGGPEMLPSLVCSQFHRCGRRQRPKSKTKDISAQAQAMRTSCSSQFSLLPKFHGGVKIWTQVDAGHAGICVTDEEFWVYETLNFRRRMLANLPNVFRKENLSLSLWSGNKSVICPGGRHYLYKHLHKLNKVNASCSEKSWKCERHKANSLQYWDLVKEKDYFKSPTKVLSC